MALPGPIPGTAIATGAFDDEGAAAADDVALAVPVVVVTAVLGDEAPN
jgi:hypothetical protein